MTDTQQFDVVVIGGGVAGAVAALAARKAGKAVACVAKAPGATAISSGAVDTIEGGPPTSFDALSEALMFARGAFPSLDLSGHVGAMTPLVLPAVFGTWKTVLMAPGTQAAADLNAVTGGEVVVVRFSDVQGDSGRSAPLLGRHALERFGVRGLAVREVEVAFDHRSRRLGVFEAASALDAEAGLAAAIGGRVAAQIEKSATALVLFEPVMGLREAPRVLADVGRAAGARCAEMLATVPSVPGRRWQNAVEMALGKAGVLVVRGEAAGFEKTGRAVNAIRTDGGEMVRGRAFVLATGRFVGGGIRREDAFSETLFGLPVACAGAPGPDTPIADLTARRITDRHTAFSAGIRTDGAMRPLDADGAPAFDNLFAAGAVIGDHGAARGPSGMGLAILTGYLAGGAAVGAL